jgi:hypothetical protein
MTQLNTLLVSVDFRERLLVLMTPFLLSQHLNGCTCGTKITHLPRLLPMA